MISSAICVSLRTLSLTPHNLPCASALLWLISIARYVSKSPSICFWRTRYDVAYLYSISWRRPGPAVIRTVCIVGRFLSRVSYLSSYVFLRKRRSFTSRKLYACLEKFLCFSCTIWSSLCFWGSMYRFFPLLIVLVPQDSRSLLTVLRDVRTVPLIMYLLVKQKYCLFCKCEILRDITILHKRVCIQM